MYLLEGRGSSREERRSATLNRVALTSLKLAAGAVAAAGCELDWRSAMFDKRFHLYCQAFSHGYHYPPDIQKLAGEINGIP